MLSPEFFGNPDIPASKLHGRTHTTCPLTQLLDGVPIMEVTKLFSTDDKASALGSQEVEQVHGLGELQPQLQLIYF